MRGKTPAPAITPAEFARVRRTRKQRAYELIRSGQLAAINMGTATRPRWLITSEALAKFDEAHAVGPVKTAERRRRRPRQIIDFYPGD
jgi:hypothetical protein